jgi:hypothetical protein
MIDYLEDKLIFLFNIDENVEQNIFEFNDLSNNEILDILFSEILSI